MFIIDMNTSLFNCLISSFLGAVIIGFALYKYKKTFYGLGCFFIKYLVSVIGILFIILIPNLPVFLSVVVANTLLIAARVLLLCGMLGFYEIKIKYKYFIVFFALYISGVIYYTYFMPSVPIRIIIFSLFSFLVHSIIFVNMYRKLNSLGKKTSAFQNINICYLIYYFTRVSVMLLSGEISSSFFDFKLDAFLLLIDGALALLLLVAIFIEIRNRTNEELAVSLKQVEFFADIYKNSPVPIMVVSSKQIIQHANIALCKLVMISEDDLIGNDWLKAFVCSESQDEVRNGLKINDPNAKFKTDTIRIKTNELKRIPVEAVMEAHNDEFGYVDYYLVYLHDLTLINETRDKMIEAERSKNNLLANIPGFAYRCRFDKDWTMEIISESFIDLTGYLPEEVIENAFISYNDIIVEKFREIVWTDWNASIDSGNPYTGEYKIRKKSGEEIWVWERGRAIFNNSGEITALEGFVSNINERKVLEEKNIMMEELLRNQQKLEAIGTLAGGVAHEINNPINGIINYGQLLLDNFELDHESQVYAKEIINESERIAEIVKNLLQFSRQQDEEFYSAEVCAIIRNSLTLIKTVLKHDNIELELNIPEKLQNIICREHQIQQVLINLITNSRDSLNEKFKETNGRKYIKISCGEFSHEGNNWIRITIEDSGKGIPEEIQSKIFEPFFTTKNRSDGQGLGLAISYGIIEEHNGNITFETKEGEYTIFHIDLPLIEN